MKSRIKSKEMLDEELSSEILATRPITEEEFKLIINTLVKGYKYIKLENNRTLMLKPNERIAMVLQVQATLGLRIRDILRLKLNNFQNGQMTIKEMKTKKMQHRKVNPAFIGSLSKYANKNNIAADEYLFDIESRVVQKILKKAVNYLGLKNIGSHSFRKFFAMRCYIDSGYNIEFVRDMLNHSTIQVTQRYLDVGQDARDQFSMNQNYIII